MQLLPFPSGPIPGGWGRLVHPREGGRSFVDETVGLVVSEMAAETALVAVRIERNRSPIPGRSGPLARTHASLSFLDEGTYAIHRGGRFLLVDPLVVAILSPFAEFEVSHPFGVERHGLSVFLADQLFFTGAERSRQLPPAMIVPLSMRSLVLEQIVRRIVRLRQGEAALEAAVRALWHSVGRDLEEATEPCRTARRGDTAERHQLAVARARAHLTKSYRRPVALDDVARAAHVSVYYLTRIFRRTTGFTIHQYLTRLRLRAALVGLADRRRLLDEVGTSVGYTTASHFAKVMRMTVGATPRELRRIILQAAPDGPELDVLAR